MGHRALVAVERPDGRYDLHRSQWGADRLGLLESLDPDAPIETDLVDPDPLQSGASAAGVLDALDPRAVEALFVLERSGVTAYLILVLSPVTARAPAPTAPAAALVPVGDPAVADRLRQFCRATKAVLGDAVDAGLVTDAVAVAYLSGRLIAHPDVPVEETIWLPPSGEPTWLPGGDR